MWRIAERWALLGFGSAGAPGAAATSRRRPRSSQQANGEPVDASANPNPAAGHGDALTGRFASTSHSWAVGASPQTLAGLAEMDPRLGHRASRGPVDDLGPAGRHRGARSGAGPDPQLSTGGERVGRDWSARSGRPARR